MAETTRRRLAIAAHGDVRAAAVLDRAATESLHLGDGAGLTAGLQLGATEALMHTAQGDLLQVGDLAKATGKTVRAIHLYEDLGLLEPVRRSKGRYRLFSAEAKVRIRWISKLQSLGLSLTDIQGIVQRRQASESARRAAQELGAVYRAKLDEVRTTIREYRALEAELEASLGFLETCSTRCESELSSSCCSNCTHHAEVPQNAPDLVVGARIE
jgi:DNA-binding transcriptional MerR regulator